MYRLWKKRNLLLLFRIQGQIKFALHSVFHVHVYIYNIIRLYWQRIWQRYWPIDDIDIFDNDIGTNETIIWGRQDRIIIWNPTFSLELLQLFVYRHLAASVLVLIRTFISANLTLLNRLTLHHPFCFLFANCFFLLI